jgi:hypothetical protein
MKQKFIPLLVVGTALLAGCNQEKPLIPAALLRLPLQL